MESVGKPLGMFLGIDMINREDPWISNAAPSAFSAIPPDHCGNDVIAIEMFSIPDPDEFLVPVEFLANHFHGIIIPYKSRGLS